MSKIIELHKDDMGEHEVTIYDFRDPETAGKEAVFMAMQINALNSLGFIRTFAHTSGDVHILQYNREEKYSIRNESVGNLVEKYVLTYPQARRKAMSNDGMTFAQIAATEKVGIPSVQDSIKLADDKIAQRQKE